MPMSMMPPSCVPTVPPTEVCDGADNDCDGKVDLGVKTRCWADADGDGYAATGAALVESCDACGAKQTAQEPAAGKVDCDDADTKKSPGATDICGDKVDNDCDGAIDEGVKNECGACGACTVTNECKEPLCTGGTGCGSRNRTGGARCSTGVCDGSGNCVACLLDSDCRAGLICDTRIKSCVVPECGDGLVTRPDEPCDAAASGTANDTWHCSPACKTRTAYILCTSAGSECAATYSCQVTSPGKSMCMPESGLGLSDTGHPNVVCPALSGYTQSLWSNAYCVISCTSSLNCPSHLSRCEDSPFAGAGPFEATKYCVAP
jgi:hypothetical protein